MIMKVHEGLQGCRKSAIMVEILRLVLLFQLLGCAFIAGLSYHPGTNKIQFHKTLLFLTINLISYKRQGSAELESTFSSKFATFDLQTCRAET